MPEDRSDHPGLHYRPPSHARGEETMRRILDAAIEVFAAEGYDGASTRALADRAKVNLPAIQYYFGSKEGLYRAAIGRIVGMIEHHLVPAAAQAAEALEGPRDPDKLFAALFVLIDAFTALVTSHSVTRSHSTFISRAEIEGKPALDLLHESVTRLGVRPSMEVVARLLERSPEDEEILVRTLAILGQIFVFHNKCNNKSARRTMHWDELDDRKVALIGKIVREQAAAILRAAMGEPK
ncbi:MAG TPA: CerR family C-terminal domain-containing protein [Stellaceae bacterium]|nr:CerR family C-terminal domain-containing protein [Stellaceae bacterium]